MSPPRMSTCGSGPWLALEQVSHAGQGWRDRDATCNGDPWKEWERVSAGRPELTAPCEQGTLCEGGRARGDLEAGSKFLQGTKLSLLTCAATRSCLERSFVCQRGKPFQDPPPSSHSVRMSVPILAQRPLDYVLPCLLVEAPLCHCDGLCWVLSEGP